MEFLLWAQETAVDAVGPEKILKWMEQYGVSWTINAIFIAGGIYALWRLFNAKNGILTRRGQKTEEQQDRLSKQQEILTTTVRDQAEQQKDLTATVKTQAETGLRVSDILEKSDERLASIQAVMERQETILVNPHSPFSTVVLNRCLLHFCDVGDQIGRKAGISAKIAKSLEDIRQEVNTHNRIIETEHSPQ